MRLKPEPYCPLCGAKMVLRRPKPNQTWKPFWGCGDYPDCNGTRGIDEDGNPEEDEIIRLPTSKKGYDYRIPTDAIGKEGDSNRCVFVLEGGQRCSSWAMRGGTYCYKHSQKRTIPK